MQICNTVTLKGNSLSYVMNDGMNCLDEQLRIHAWGDSLEEAFEQSAMAMFAYMTEIEYVQMVESQDIEAEGHDILSLLFHFLDEFLFLFCAEPFFIARKVKILEFDRENFRIKARGYGEEFVIGKHPQGTEVKAITYSNMQVHEKEGHCELFVIIDI
uniref:Archease domain-containing protein n=2 Tax=Timema TaxID=61471 RepID=A0A7R9NX07_9NEOP|nr:unnamed protein product [Timema bartmani]CAD7459348.1 unnamed protein product [Timema tahoe]